jgi:hypothetical protein
MFGNPSAREVLIVFLVLSAFSPAAVLARTWVVAQDGSGDFEFISQACQAAASGDSVVVHPGLYEEQSPLIIIRYKALSILGTTPLPDDTVLRVRFLFDSCNGTLVQDLSFIGAVRAIGIMGGPATIRRCAIRDCVSDNGDPAVTTMLEGPYVVEDCVFEGNQNPGSPETRNGGAVAGIHMTVRNCLFVDNHADGHGGACYLESSSVESCVFFRNSARTAAAVEIEHEGWVTHCTMLANRVTDTVTPGGAIRCGGTADHLIVAGTIGGTGAECWDGGDYHCCDFWDNEDGAGIGSFCGIHDWLGDFSADPRFCDPVTGDVGLMEGSPCLPGIHWGVDCGLIGARGLGCGIVQIQETSWGVLKALYR